MSINGVCIEKCNDTILCHIDHFSDDLKELIRKHLTSVAHGDEVLEDDTDESDDFFSYKNTVREFLTRYDGKPEETQKGIIGELLAHIILIDCLESFEPVSSIFNIEDRGVKKGFDIIHFDTLNNCIWYSEVKSSEPSFKKTLDQSNRTVLQVSKRSILKDKFKTPEYSTWQNAIAHAKVMFNSREKIKNITTLLKLDYQNTQKPNDKKNVILISVIYRDDNHKITKQSLDDFHQYIVGEKHFNSAIIFSIKKKMFQTVEEFLRQEVEHA